jgi:hypothetical protein
MEDLMKSIDTENSPEQNKQAIKETRAILSQLCKWERAGITLTYGGLTARQWRRNFRKAMREFKRIRKTK